MDSLREARERQIIDQLVARTYDRFVDSYASWSVEVDTFVVVLKPSLRLVRTIALALVLVAVFEGAGALFQSAASWAGGPAEMQQYARPFCRIVGAIVIFMFVAARSIAHSRGPAILFDRERGLLTVREAAPMTTDPRRATVVHWTVGLMDPDHKVLPGPVERVEVVAYLDTATDIYVPIVATCGPTGRWKKLCVTLASALGAEYRHRAVEVPLRKS